MTDIERVGSLDQFVKAVATQTRKWQKGPAHGFGLAAVVPPTLPPLWNRPAYNRNWYVPRRRSISNPVLSP